MRRAEPDRIPSECIDCGAAACGGAVGSIAGRAAAKAGCEASGTWLAGSVAGMSSHAVCAIVFTGMLAVRPVTRLAADNWNFHAELHRREFLDTAAAAASYVRPSTAVAATAAGHLTRTIRVESPAAAQAPLSAPAPAMMTRALEAVAQNATSSAVRNAPQIHSPFTDALGSSLVATGHCIETCCEQGCNCIASTATEVVWPGMQGAAAATVLWGVARGATELAKYAARHLAQRARVSDIEEGRLHQT